MQSTTSPTYTVDQFAKASCLPSLPEVACKLLELAQQPDPDTREIAKVIRLDPAICDKFMKTANSALLGFRPKVESIDDAVNKLGLKMIRTLLLSFHLAEHKTINRDLERMIQDHWRSSLTQAVLAELIAGHLKVSSSSFFLAAMVQDVGILAMLSEAPTTYVNEVLSLATFPSVAAAERSVFGFCHADVSTAIVRDWGLPSSFEEAILRHHDQFNSHEQDDEHQTRIAISQAASLGADVILARGNGAIENSLERWTDFLQTHFSIGHEKIDEIITEVNSLVSDYSAVFKFNISDGARAEDTVRKAKAVLQQIALENQMEMVSKRLVRQTQSADSELYRDELSGLNNRRYLNKNLQQLMATAIKKDQPIAILFIDLDRFKSINDTMGHRVGDQAIKHVADWLQHSIRSADTAVRLGGDEFLLILNQIELPEFRNAAQRIATEIPPLQTDDLALEVSLSVGGAFYEPSPDDESDPNWLIDQADRCMYKAKRDGGRTVSIEHFIGMDRDIESETTNNTHHQVP